jgi:hypothetical protein
VSRERSPGGDKEHPAGAVSGRFDEKATISTIFAVTKSLKVVFRPFPKQAGVGTYRPRPQGLWGQGLPSQEASGRERRPRALPQPFRLFRKGHNGFIAGWSSPVARQAHNLKVTGSNPVPATKSKTPQSLGLRGFGFWTPVAGKNAGEVSNDSRVNPGADYLVGESLDINSISNSPSYVSAPTFNASATRACVTSLATLKSDSWASTRSPSAKEANAPRSTAALT